MTWVEKYELLLKDELISKDINKIMGWQYPQTKEWRTELITNLDDRGIKLTNVNKIPTELFLEAIGKDMKYFERKMIEEHKLRKIKAEMEDI